MAVPGEHPRPSTYSASFIVLAGCIPLTDDVEVDLGRIVRLTELPTRAFTQFSSKADQFIADSVIGYYRRFANQLPWRVLVDRLEREPDDVRRDVAARYTALKDFKPDKGEWEWAYSKLWDQWERQEAVRTLTSALRAATDREVVPKDDGTSVVYEGFEGVQSIVYNGFARITREQPAAVPEWDTHTDVRVLLDDIGSARRRVHFPTGIEVIDENTLGGPALGELWFVAAYAGSGKTTFSVSVMAYQALMRGLNVVYASGETLLDQVRRRVAVRHVRDPRFHTPAGVPLSGISLGDITPQQREAYTIAANDLIDGSREGRYGRLWVYQMPLRETFDGVLERLRDYERIAPIHVLIVDSVDMVAAKPHNNRRYNSYREQMSDVIEEFASLAVGYRNGRGLCVISPYQISRDAYDNALTNSNRYELSALSETSMAERRAAVVLSLLADSENPARVSMQLLKVRHGRTGDFKLDVDWPTGYMGTSTAVTAPTGGSVAHLLDV